MKVCLSVKGRFHAFDLARELERHGRLARLITSYPRGVAAAFGVARDRVRSVTSSEVMSRCAERLVSPGRVDAALHRHFDRRAMRLIDPGADLFVGWSGVCLESLTRASELGQVTIVERGSCHIETQRELLLDEADRLGRPLVAPSPAVVEQELREYDRADFIALPGAFARDTFLSRGVRPEKLLVAPYGVTLDGFSPAVRPPDRFRVMYCGAVSAQKGVHYLLEAFHSLGAIDAELWLVGPVLPELEGALSRYASPRVRVLGARRGRDLPSLYRQCSVFCLPSVQDGMGMVLLQAMASGLPVIATEHTGGPDLISHGEEGFLTPIRDARAIAASIELLRSDENRRRAMGAAARATAQRDHSWSSYGRRVMENYARALDGTRVVGAWP